MSDDTHDTPTGEWSPGDADFTVEFCKSFEAVLDRFEAAWQSGEPDIEQYALARPGDDALVVELCLVDLEHRRRRGLPAAMEAYTARFPTLASRTLAAVLRTAALCAGTALRDPRRRRPHHPHPLRAAET